MVTRFLSTQHGTGDDSYMEWIMILAGGLALGMAHSFDPDHIAAVTTWVPPGATRRNALRAGLLWGIGHSLTLGSVALLLVWLGYTVGPVLETGFEIVVAGVLIALGLWRLSLALRGPECNFRSDKIFWAPVTVGILHGLAGSAGAMILIPVFMLDSLAYCALYLLCFSAGSILSMTFFTGTLAGAQNSLAARLYHARAWLGGTAGAFSFSVGAWWLVSALP